jgi:hypothetical protein
MILFSRRSTNDERIFVVLRLVMFFKGPLKPWVFTFSLQPLKRKTFSVLQCRGDLLHYANEVKQEVSRKDQV